MIIVSDYSIVSDSTIARGKTKVNTFCVNSIIFMIDFEHLSLYNDCIYTTWIRRANHENNQSL